MLRIATANINGIRATHRRGFGDWLAERGCDVVALQEVRAQADKIPDDAFGSYHVALDTGSLPGRNGVAVLTRSAPAAVRTWSGTALVGGPSGATGATGATEETDAAGPTDSAGMTGTSRTDGPMMTRAGDIATSPHHEPVGDGGLRPSTAGTAGSTGAARPTGTAGPAGAAGPTGTARPTGEARPLPTLGPALDLVASPDHVPLSRGLGPFADQGRYLEVDLADAPVTIACLYLPKGGLPAELQRPERMREAPDGGARYARKMGFMAAFSRYLTSTRRAALAAGREFLLMGDLNIAHTRQDLAAWRRNQQNDGFLPEEREWFGQQLSPRTLVDVVRSLHPDEDGPYSWWSWLGQSFAKDAGWRLDYHLATPRLARSAVRAEVDRDFRGVRLSDHSPVVVDYELR
ncbi:exodeoxyribonuclease III [Brachybacterium tyrofermentans]|uniref:exodeoxyribonuclease III n=1 Tax=Brachybacterium tyrofermentans TaxID=47848 RepID=UPI003F918B20